MSDRDEAADYKAALLDEYDSYTRAGRTEEAALVAAVLRKRHGHGHEAEGRPAEETVVESPPLERADIEPAPETAVPRKPGRPRKPIEDSSES